MAISLASISRSTALAAPRIVIYAENGLGKTTFAAGAPNPIFVPCEDGLGSVDVAHFPLCRKVADVSDAIGCLYNEKHDYKTVVLDSADWCEALIEADIQSTHEAKDLAYGKGNVKIAEQWRSLLTGLDALRNERGMVVVVIAHCKITRFDSPETEPYDRYGLKLTDRSAGVLMEWADAVLFANYRTVIKKADVGFSRTVSRGISTGERLMFTTEKPAYRAKNRYSLPDELPLSWDALAGAIAAGRPEEVEK